MSEREEKWTPGPWSFSPALPDKNFCAQIWGGPEECSLAVIEDFDGETNANAALISAAPDLYEALDEMVRRTEEWNASMEKIIGRQPNSGIGLEKAKAALRKARVE